MNESSLTALFKEDIGIATSLLELINAELAALAVPDLARLQELLNQKQPLLALLAQHATTRSQLLAAEQLSPDRSGLIELAGRSEAGQALMQKGDELGVLIEQCQQANLRNGRLIKANQATLGKLLGLLRGNDTPALYDSKGSAARIGQHRPLSQA